MNFLWDMVLRAQDQGIGQEDLFFTQAEEYSPYYEQSFSCVNETRIDSNRIELNLLYRFGDIFQEILSQKLQEELGQRENDYAQFREYFIDAALHTLLYWDLRHGLTKREVCIRKLTGELAEGEFWKEISQDFLLLDSHKQIRLATLVLTQMETGSSLIIYRRSLLVLFPNAMLYQIKADRKKLLLYLPQRKTRERERMVRFVQDLFLPMSYSIRIFWEHHFGVIGFDAAMAIDKTAVY